MKKVILVLPTLFLTGCLSVVPVKQEWPAVPDDLLNTCPNLKQVDPNVSKLSDIIDVVGDNYVQYYDCKEKVNDWITWYNGQKQIRNGE